jgi:hypothetical protein
LTPESWISGVALRASLTRVADVIGAELSGVIA